MLELQWMTGCPGIMPAVFKTFDDKVGVHGLVPEAYKYCRAIQGLLRR
jgi:hypothetical protein